MVARAVGPLAERAGSRALAGGFLVRFLIFFVTGLSGFLGGADGVPTKSWAFWTKGAVFRYRTACQARTLCETFSACPMLIILV